MRTTAADFAESAVALCIGERNLRAMEECCRMDRTLGLARIDVGHIAEVVRRTPGSRLAVVAAAFGVLPLRGERRGWVDVGGERGGAGVVPSGDDEAACAFALWRALGGRVTRPLHVPPTPTDPARDVPVGGPRAPAD
ncbi:MAG: hypothetical protein AMXMBFR77_01350 [Phycisphaerales bacterium]|nr:hypothetical protein [Leptolyngbya sp.]MCQ3939575.1 hypothetical protein [cyanobacterium CYA1]MDL1903831.1 hypothetical protein [Synechococcales cyanobacterium CNB]